MVRIVRLIGFSLVFGAAAAVLRAQAGQGSGDERSPRFLIASAPSTAPVRATAVQVPALRRRLSLALEGATLGEALAAIARQSGLQFMYSNAVVPQQRKVHLKADDITVAAALTEVLLDTDIDVVFERGGRAMLVRRAGPLPPASQGGAIVGRVSDVKTHAPIAAAEILLEGTRRHAVADTAGWYRLTEVDTGTYTLTTRRLGYTKQSRRVTVRAGQDDTVNVALEPRAVPLDELVTTATGQQRRRDLGNAITTIRADSVMRHAVVRSLTDLLDKRVPGLTTQHTSGAPGDPAKLRLRGLGSVLRSNDPVVIVDGARVYAAQSEARSGNLTNTLFAGRTDAPPALPAPSPLDQIDPNTIEKIEVFKGASASTLYGADAANGVIVVTTKRGKPGPTHWNANLVYGRTDQPGRWPTGYYRWGHDQFTNSARFCTLLDLNCVQDSLVQFQALDLPNLTIVDQGRRANLSLSANGGTQALTYSVTGTYGDETGLLKLPAFEAERFRMLHQREAPDWMRNSQRYQSWAVTSNMTARLSQAADVMLSSSLTRSEQRRTSLENQLSALQGTYIDTVNQIYYTPNSCTPSDDIQCGGDRYTLNTTTDILKDYYRRTTATTITFTTSLNANWHPRSWFTASGLASLNVTPRDDQALLEGGLLTLTDSGSLARGSGRSVVSTLDVQGALTKPLGHGFLFRTSVGTNLTSTTISDLASAAEKLAPGTQGFIGARGFTTTDQRLSTSVFGWYIEPTITGQRLSLSTGLRLDGGSAYGARISGLGGGGGGFLRGLLALPKLNGSWVISEEPWFPFKTLVSSLRLRGAYGQAQVQPGAADRLRLYTQTVRLTTLGNTELRPERSTEIEGGFEAELLDSRLMLDVTGYRRLQIDALMNVELPASVNGGGSVVKNVGNIRNRGLEIVLGLSPLHSSALTWGTQLIYSRNSNTLLKLGRGVEPNRSAGLVAGYPVGSRWTYPIVGFDDANGNGVIQLSEIQLGDSLVYTGRLQPAYTLALNTNVAFFGGAVTITAGANYDAGMTQVNALANGNWVLNRALVDPSTPLSEQAAVLAAGRSINGITSQYGLMQEVSTWRFQSLTVNYQTPERVARLLGAQRLSIALQGQNLGLHSSYRGKDPDVNAWSPGEYVSDAGQLPQPRTWQLSVFLDY